MNFSVATALRCAEAIRDVARGKTEPTFVCRETDTQVRFEIINGITFIIFPGSASVTDWRTNAKVRKTAWMGSRGAVHRGFASAYQSVGMHISAAARGAEAIIVTGHSLGGACATLCADLMAQLGHPIVGVYTFGCPRVGNAAFARAFNLALADRSFRVVNAGDPVPHLPFVFGTYRHVETQVYLHRDHSIRIDQPLRTAFTEAVTQFGAGYDAGRAQSALLGGDAHSLTSYIGKLRDSN